MFKHFANTQIIKWTIPLIIPERATRGHTRKYRAESATHHTPTSRFQFLPNRVAEWWNQLPDSVVNAASVNAFKNEYDKFYVPPARLVPPIIQRPNDGSPAAYVV